MNYLVTDLECTCTDQEEFPREEMEIIEIGSVLLNPQLEIIGEYSIFVKPTKNSTLTTFCKDLTKIKQEWVDNAQTIDKVLPNWEKWARMHGDYTFTSWGGFDYRQIQRESNWKRIHNPLMENQLNYKVRMAKIKNLKRRNGVGVQKALNILNMKFVGTPHRAIDDTRNIVRIIKKCGIDFNEKNY